ncbi:MAG: DUF502 domain-containing protein [Candidatus Omnitrophica bacterium]|nr:DUF502 domain-containing protein [Candidatus Omnitrophota bacterium]MBI5024992.1 DUF502 domain-containing protein [Candidatus Omnitrophota bacterium]
MKNFLSHARMYVFRGLLAIIPLGLTIIAIRLVYVVIDKRIIEALAKVIGYRIPGLGVLLVLVLLYFLGLITSNVLGRRLLHAFESIFQRIPLIKTTYQVGKQISTTLSLPERQVFKKVVLVNLFQPGQRGIGFVTGTVIDKKNQQQLLKIFIPTVPNPTSGFLVLMKESDTVDPGWSVDEAMKTVISGGIIGPEVIEKK